MENKTQIEADKIGIRDLLFLIWENRQNILKLTSVFLAIGIIIAFSIPREYTCIVKLVPEESKPGISGNISSLAAMAGINIGATTNIDGINLTLYPDVVKSIPFLYELSMLKIPSESNREQTLYNYIDKELRDPWWNAVLGLPLKIIDLFKRDEDSININFNPYSLNKSQELNIMKLNERLHLSINKKTGIMSIGISMQDPVISAMLADSLVTKLEQYIIRYRTSKAKQDYDFALKMFEDARNKYYESQRNYARYMDENKNLIYASVRIEQERLENEQMLHYNVYASLAQQLETVRLKVQEQTPCLTIIEPARIPANKSNTSKLQIITGFILLGLVFGVTLKVIYPNWHRM